MKWDESNLSTSEWPQVSQTIHDKCHLFMVYLLPSLQRVYVRITLRAADHKPIPWRIHVFDPRST
jgi:hypothetical protein